MDFHWSQYAYVALLVLALCAGKPGRTVVLVMLGNWVLSAFLAEDPIEVAMVDIGAAVILLGEDLRRNIVAAVYCLMVFVAVAGDAVGLSNAAIYTVIDLLAVVQLLVIGRADGGLRRIGRSLWSAVSGRRDLVRGPVASRDYASGGHRVSVRSEKVSHER